MSGTLAPEVGIILTVRIRSSVVGASLMVTTIFQSFGACANVQRQQQPIFCEPVATSPNLPFSQLLPVFAVTSPTSDGRQSRDRSSATPESSARLQLRDRQTRWHRLSDFVASALRCRLVAPNGPTRAREQRLRSHFSVDWRTSRHYSAYLTFRIHPVFSLRLRS